MWRDSEPYEVLKDRGDVAGEQESSRVVDILEFFEFCGSVECMDESFCSCEGELWTEDKELKGTENGNKS